MLVGRKVTPMSIYSGYPGPLTLLASSSPGSAPSRVSGGEQPIATLDTDAHRRWIAAIRHIEAALRLFDAITEGPAEGVAGPQASDTQDVLDRSKRRLRRAMRGDLAARVRGPEGLDMSDLAEHPSDI